MSAAARAPGVSHGTRVREGPQGRAGPTGLKVSQKVLLVCGILSSLLYGAMITLIRYEGYHPTSQVPSELTAIGAPTRALWMVLGPAYDVLVVAFGVASGFRRVRSALLGSSVAYSLRSGYSVASRGHLPRCINVRCLRRAGEPCPIPCTSFSGS